MKNFTLLAAISALLVVVFSDRTQAASFTEIGDAGETLGTAQVIQSGSQPLESISGTLFRDADVFNIFLTGGQTFSATTISPGTLVELPVDNLLGVPTKVLEDPQLFLFDSSGRGVYANDDSFGSSQSTLPSGGFSPSDSGIYYLALSSFDYDPVSTGGVIFPSEPSTEVYGPTGPGGGLSLSGFEGASNSSGNYSIALSGAQTVPEPSSTLGMLAFGALGAVFWLRKKRKK